MRAIQLAKAALYAGARLLMDQLGVEHVDRIALAGAFGSHIDVKYAMVLGMIPDCALEKVSSAGNAAGTGARIALLKARRAARSSSVVRRIEKIETAIEPRFQEHFVGAMAIPHKSAPYPNLRRPCRLPAPAKTAAAGECRRTPAAAPAPRLRPAAFVFAPAFPVIPSGRPGFPASWRRNRGRGQGRPWQRSRGGSPDGGGGWDGRRHGGERPSFPPLYRPFAVTPEVDPFDRCVIVAAEGAEAGTVLWSIGQEACQCAIVLAPEHSLEASLPIVLVAMLGLGDALGGLVPPVVSVTFGWPDRIEVNGGVIGGVRMACGPTEPPSGIPDWISSATASRCAGPGPRTPSPADDLFRTTLADEGCGEVQTIDLLEAFARHLLAWLNRWQEDGVGPVQQAWLRARHRARQGARARDRRPERRTAPSPASARVAPCVWRRTA